MTPAILFDLCEAEAKVRLAAATLDITRHPDSERFALLLEAATRLARAREALHEMARAPVPPPLRDPARRFRVIEGGAA
jgi:hypothetical protein